MAVSENDGGRFSPRLIVVAIVGQVALIGVLVLLAVGGLPFTGAKDKGGGPEAQTAVAGKVPHARFDRFDGAAAMRIAKLQVDAGQRPAGSPQLRRLAVKLAGLLPDAHFEDVPGHPGLRNIVGQLPGPGPVIVIGAHYDSEYHPKGFVGANDAAAAVGTVIELARSIRRLRRTAVSPGIRFVLFDGEEEPFPTSDFYRDALRGSKSYVQIHAEEVRAMILLDYIGNTGVRFPREGTSTPSLWSQVRGAADRVGVQGIFPNRSEVSIFDDHTPFLRAGIPAVDLIDWSYKYKDGLQDTYDKLSVDSVDAVGETITELIRTWPTDGTPAG
ncbi:Zn-dependent exopeptidase M28 [Baekduia soli]|uniref:Zn-dependent exopeptidase M28 n=1 Tax=Baekduia soli TaxID=496014 RepID=A0A5B8UAB2_9ACTN|nr:M28 family metallopeptidase [Baekduia soli]QEC49975.1 Zn-dependent exopeptidase M28 [Baekduia soli]